MREGDHEVEEETTDSALERRLRRLESEAKNARFWRRVAVGLIGLAVALPLAVDALGPVPHTFSSGQVISASDINENFTYLQNAITALENESPVVTIRKAGTASTSIAFCQSDEVVIGGGCFLPPENAYDPLYPDVATYNTGSFPRAMVGLTSVPVAAGVSTSDIRPRAPTGGIVPFPGDPIAAGSGSAVSALGGGWACRPGTLDHDMTGGAQGYASSGMYEGWFYPVKAYAICLRQ